jgi:Probable transposase.
MNKKGDEFVKTKNIIKDEKKLLKMHQRLSNIRKNYLHHTSKEIVGKNPKFICIDDLNIQSMMKNSILQKLFKNSLFTNLAGSLNIRAKF